MKIDTIQRSKQQPPVELPRVVIVGAGFGGLQAAKALRKVPVQVTVIDRINHHLFQPPVAMQEGHYVASVLADRVAGKAHRRPFYYFDTCSGVRAWWEERLPMNMQQKEQEQWNNLPCLRMRQQAIACPPAGHTCTGTRVSPLL